MSKTITLHAAELVVRFGWLQRGSCLCTESVLSKLISTECGTISTQLGRASLALAYCNWCIYLFIIVLMQLGTELGAVLMQLCCAVLGAGSSTVSTQLGRASLALAYCNWCTFLFI